ncbi:MAG: ExeM/NucH family extracellular endonuclease, partial [Lysobacterales bacterium]
MNQHSSRILPATIIFTLSLMAWPSHNVQAVSTDVVISQVYGGGGNSGATLTHDFIELFNRGATPVSLAGWSVQYASATGTGNFGSSAGQLTELPNISLAPGQYVLIQEAQGSGGTTALPTPDVTDATPIGMSGTAGKVALVMSTASLGCNGGSTPCDSAQLALIKDLVGWGTANFFETTAAPATANATASMRAADGCTDTDNNGADFSTETPVPRNAASPLNLCVVAPESAPTVASTVPVNGAAGVAADANLTVNFSEPVDLAGNWFDIDCSTSGSHSATSSGGPISFSLDPDTDFQLGETCTVTVFAANVTDQDADDPPDSMAADYVFSFDTLVLVKIHHVQGTGASSPMVGNTVVIEGIVVGDFQDGASGTNGDLNGFHVQEEDVDADTNPLTSEGIFVFNGSSPAVNVQIGDLVQVIGEVSEFNGMTEITSFTGVSVVSSGNPLPTAAVLSLPVTSLDAFEAVEGMRVTFPQALVISEYFNFDRFGEIVLTSERHLTPTAEFPPGPDAIQAAADFLLDKITLDDGRSAQNPDPAIHPNGGVFDLTNLFRGGDTLANVTGVMDYSIGLYRIQPTQGADYNSENPRTAAPEDVGGSIKVASFNVLNYFSTLDNGVNDICGPAQDQECRGADDANEFTRQRDKIIAALTAIDADIVGLLEIENNVNDDAVIDLVAGLNAVNGAGTYDYVSTGTIGTDAIKVALIYQPASVAPVGAYAILDSSVDPDFLDTKNRPTLAQTFADNVGGGVFTIAVNHFKSKGSDCNDVGDPDLGDGAGNCNLTRAAAAQALVDWLATDPTGSGDDDFLIIGDLNSYDKEDPIVVLNDAGYTDLAFIFGGESAYGYVFDGQIGYLDYALASPTLFDQVSAATEWHINADEPDLIDYDTSFKQPAQDAIYAPDPYRSSDHDPVIAGLELLHYDFSGFFAPVRDMPELNSAKAGSSVAVKFSLAGDYGLDIIVDGYPQSQEIDCDSGTPNGSEATMTAGGSSL